MVIVWTALILGRTFVNHLGLLVSPVATPTISNSLDLLIIGLAAAGISIVAVILSLRIDWGKIIGKWFPWTIEEGKESTEEDR